MNPSSSFSESDVRRLVEKSLTKESPTDAEVEMLAMTGPTPEQDEDIFTAFTHLVNGNRLSDSQITILANRLCEKAKHPTTPTNFFS